MGGGKTGAGLSKKGAVWGNKGGRGGARRGNGSEVLAIVRKQNQCTVHSQYT